MFEEYLKDLTNQFYTAYFRILDERRRVRPLEAVYDLCETFGDGYMLTYRVNEKKGINVARAATGTWEIWVPVNQRRSERIKTVKQSLSTKNENVLSKILGIFTKEFIKAF